MVTEMADIEKDHGRVAMMYRVSVFMDNLPSNAIALDHRSRRQESPFAPMRFLGQIADS